MIASPIRVAPETWWIPCACTAFTNRRRGPLPKFRANHRQSGNNDGIQPRVLRLRLRMAEHPRRFAPANHFV
jgi:hypothetical protein